MRPPEIGQHGQAEPHLGPPGPDALRSGACEPWEEVEAGQAAQAESGRGLPRPEGKKLLFGPGRKRMGERGSQPGALDLGRPPVSFHA